MTPPKKPLILDMVMCDWLTLTSFDDSLYKAFMKSFEWLTEFETVKRMQYDGRQYGSVFIGTAEQHGRHHNLVQISGSTADEYIGEWSNDDSVRCSRMDLQVTCGTNGVDMFAFAERQKGKKRLVGFIESGGLATVYIGSWKSNKFLRIYQKSRTVLRLEACYKGSKANHLHMFVGLPGDETRARMRGLLRSELDMLEDDVMDEIFGASLHGKALMPKMSPRPETQTEKWILQTVIPALAKYANSHESDLTVLTAIMAAIGVKNVNSEL